MIPGLNWNAYFNKQIAKSYSVLQLLPREIAYNVNMRVKTCLYKSLILPNLIYGIQCIYLPSSIITILGKFQKKVVNWICRTGSYTQQIRMLNILPLPIYIFVATFTALKRTTRQHRATTNTGYVITIKWTELKLPKTITKKCKKNSSSAHLDWPLN